MFGGISRTALAVTLLAGSAVAIDVKIRDERKSDALYKYQSSRDLKPTQPHRIHQGCRQNPRLEHNVLLLGSGLGHPRHSVKFALLGRKRAFQHHDAVLGSHW